MDAPINAVATRKALSPSAKRTLRRLARSGVSLAMVRAELPSELHQEVDRIWIDAQQPARKTPSYGQAIEYIARNDEPTNLCDDPDDADYLGGQPTVQLAALLFGKDVHNVVTDVVAYRRAEQEQ